MKNGFTLAEVLVTLGIIGVVSALTLPTLVKNHQRKVYVTQLHKAYNQISQAFELVMSDSNAIRIRESTLTRNGVENFMRNYFKTTQICTGNSVTDCFASEYENMNGNAFTLGIFGTDTSHNTASMITADGASIFISVPISFSNSVDSRIWIVLDINGKQEPNILGRDLFDYAIDQNGNISQPQEIADLISSFSTTCGSATNFAGNGGVETRACFGKILDDGWEMDY